MSNPLGNHGVRKTVAFDSSEIARENPRLKRQLEHARALYPAALIENIANSTVPVPERSRRSNYRIWLDPSSAVHEELVAQALHARHHPHEDVDAAAYNFFHATAASLMMFQEAAYEIVDMRDSERRSPRIRLVSIPPGSIQGTQEKLIQRLPETVAQSMGRPNKLPLDPNTILIFRLPLSVRNELPHIIEALAALSDPFPPDFALPSMKSNTSKIAFDWQRFSRTKHIALANATRSIGWTPGSFELREGKATEHYFWHRQLVLERFKIELRDGMLATLNDGLDRIGTLVGAKFALRIDGLPTLDEIEKTRSHLLAGDLSLTEIEKTFRIR